MKGFARGVAILLGFALHAGAAPQDGCADRLPHVMQVGIPRTSLDEEALAEVARSIRAVLEPSYVDVCGKEKNLQINLALGSDYEVLEWIAQKRIDAAIVPDLSRWLLTNRDGMPLFELNDDASGLLSLLAPVSASPAAARVKGKTWVRNEQNAEAVFDALIKEIIEEVDAGVKTDKRVVFASHLSSSGFLHPLRRAAEKFAHTNKDQDALWNELFKVARFAVRPAPHEQAFAFAGAEEPEADLLVVSYPGEETLLTTPDLVRKGRTYREHFIALPRITRLFRKGLFKDLKETSTPDPTPPPDPFLSLLEAPRPPRPLEQIARAEPAFGVRTYAFTIEESLRLLAQQQKSSGRSDLALVLPGGGVKAAYQSRIIDHLYDNRGDRRRLSNAGAAAKDSALSVTSVLGTSGGALLGYFVSQLGPKGPFTLTQILWQPENKTLEARQVFGVTDMPRYFSIVWAFFVFCVLLAFFTGWHGSQFYRRATAPNPAWRAQLLTVLAVFILVPVLIRFVSGGDDIEHVPVVEGLFYLILTVLVMFADQCLVYTAQPDHEPRLLRWHWVSVAKLGGILVVASLAGAFFPALRQAVPFWVAFFTLSFIFLASPLVLLKASGRLPESKHRTRDVVTASLAAIAFCAFGVPGWQPGAVPHLFALLALIILAVLTYLHSHLERSRVVSWLLMFLTLCSTAILCWSEKFPISLRPRLSYFTHDAFEETPLPAFLVSTGSLLLVMSVMLWVYQSRHYTLRNGRDFALGLGLLAAHCSLSWLLVVGLAGVFPDRVHSLEMTGSFWIALTVFGALIALLILRFGTRWALLYRSVSFLSSEHPNGALMPRRYARMFAVAALSVVWWNYLVAPALYGNKPARNYLKGTVSRFDKAINHAHCPSCSDSAKAKTRRFAPTARFVATANSLDEYNATRYFLFEPHAEPPSDFAQRVAGAEWKIYGTAAQGDCKKTIGAGCTSFVQNVVFSSGSPFPIFAAHRVPMLEEEKSLRLIDGGYSNDIPIDAARTIQASQALVIHSAPFETDANEPEPKKPLFTPGMLVRNAGRLPSFMFERGQQADRLSRQSLFVVAIAPKPGAGSPWPGLAQFDRATIDGLIKTAETNLTERVAFVESWGEPRVRFSQQIEIGPLARPATTGGAGSPAPASTRSR